MYFDGRIKMFIKKMENVLNRQGAMEFFFRLDIIRNLSTSNSGDSPENHRFAMDEKIKINMYLNKLMPSAYKDSEQIYRQNYKNVRLENITEENQPKQPKNISNITNTLTIPPSSKLTSLSKQPNITINKVKESKFYKLSTINSKYNNFIQGESEVPFFPPEIKNTITSLKQRGTVLSSENINKREMFNPKMGNKVVSILPSSANNLNLQYSPERNKPRHYNSVVYEQNQTNIYQQHPHPSRTNLRSNYQLPTIINQSATVVNNNNLKNIQNRLSIKYSNLVRIGDVVLMRYNYKNKITQETNEGILYPEKVISKQIFCIPLDKIEELGGGKSIFKRSLFRIENPQNCIFQYQYENAKKLLKNKKNDKLLTQEEESVKELCILANEEKKEMKVNFSLTIIMKLHMAK